MGDLVQLQKVGSDKDILYIESDTRLQKSFGIYLQKTFKNFYATNNGDQAYEIFLKNKPQVVLMELNYEGKDPIELIDDIKQIRPDTVIISLSSKDENYELLQTLDMGLSKMLLKPLSFPKLADVLIELLPPAPIIKPIIKKVEQKPVQPRKTILTKKPLLKKSPEVVKKEVPKKQEHPVEEKQEVVKQAPKNPEVKEKLPVKKDLPIKKEVPKEKTKTELCFEFIRNLVKSKEILEFFNHYKGVSVQNHGDIISCQNDRFEVKVRLAQIIAAKYEKFVIMRTQDNKYIHAKLHEINLKNATLILKEPRFLEYKNRDKNYNRFRADKSCKASIYVNKKLVEFSVEHLSFKSAELITTNKQINISKGDTFDLTLGFDLGGPNKMITEKKFVKVFAKCSVLRIDDKEKYNKIIVLLQVNKSGERTLLKYLSQREEEIMNEFKNIIHR